jgi:hypothetical protein
VPKGAGLSRSITLLHVNHPEHAEAFAAYLALELQEIDSKHGRSFDDHQFVE